MHASPEHCDVVFKGAPVPGSHSADSEAEATAAAAAAAASSPHDTAAASGRLDTTLEAPTHSLNLNAEPLDTTADPAAFGASQDTEGSGMGSGAIDDIAGQEQLAADFAMMGMGGAESPDSGASEANGDEVWGGSGFV